MYSVSSNFKNYIKMPSRTLSARMVIGSTTYTDTEIVDMNLESNLVPGEEFTLGTTICNKYEATLMTSNVIATLAVTKPYLGLNINGSSEEVPLGIFNLDTPIINKNKVKITGYDNMIKFEKAYFSDLKYPATIQSVATEICQKAGVSFSSVLANVSIDKIEGKTLREAIGIIAGISGGFARINRAGNLEIIGLTSTDISVTTDNFFGSIEKADKNFTIKKITAIKEDNSTVSSGSGLSSEEITFSNNYITQAQLDSVLTIYNGYSYRPIKFTWQGNPAIDVGDKVTITDIDNTTYSIPVMRLKLTYAGGLKSEISSISKSDSKSEYDYKGPVTKKVERLVIEQANIKVLMAEKATIEDLTVATARITTLESNSATITNLNAAVGRIDYLESSYASIQNVLAGNVGANNLAAGAIQAGSAVIAAGAIGNAQISDLDVTKLNAGDISTSKFRIVSASGNMLISDNTIQIKDASRVRVQIGKDASNDYNMYVWDSSGNLMFDATGLKASGIKSKIIRDDMVSDTANINGSKIEKESLVTQINGATTTLKASKVKLDTENQTLDLAFTSLKSTVTSQGSTITSQGTSISTIQGQISSKVWQTDIDTSINNLNTMTKLNGEELISQNFKKGVDDKPFTSGSYLLVNNILASPISEQYVIKVTNSTFLKSDFIPFDLSRPFYTMITAYNEATTNGVLYIGIEFYDKDKISLGSNDLAIYSISSDTTALPVNTWKTFEGYVNVLPTDGTRIKAAFVRLRILTRWSGNTGITYFKDISLKQLGSQVLPSAIIRITTTESNITQLNTSISLKVDTSTFNSYKTSNDSAVSSLTSRVSSAELKITDSAIVSTVRNSTAYASDLGAKANQTDLNSLATRVSTAESSIIQLNNSIALKVSQTDFNSLTGRVSTTESNITILQGQISSKVNVGDFGTLVTQNASSVKVAIGEIGGENLVRNGRGNFSTVGWSTQTAILTWEYLPDLGVNSLKLGNSSTSQEAYVDTIDWLPVKTNTTYTISFTVWVGGVAYFYARISGQQTGLIKNGDKLYFNGKYNKIQFTFNTGSNTNIYPRLLLGPSASSSTGYVWITDIAIREGDNPSQNWVPNSNELKTSSFEVTKEYARFTSSDGSFTEFVPGQTGLKWHKGSTSKDYHYLNYQGTASIAYTHDVIIQLSDEFKGKDVGISVSIKSMGSTTAFTYVTNIGAWGYVENKANGTIRLTGMCQTVTTDVNGTYQYSSMYNYFDVAYTVTA